MSWKNIRGHDAQVDHFRKLLTAGRLPHALILEIFTDGGIGTEIHL